jgi:hypothetical protein
MDKGIHWPSSTCHSPPPPSHLPPPHPAPTSPYPHEATIWYAWTAPATGILRLESRHAYSQVQEVAVAVFADTTLISRLVQLSLADCRDLDPVYYPPSNVSYATSETTCFQLPVISGRVYDIQVGPCVRTCGCVCCMQFAFVHASLLKLDPFGPLFPPTLPS